MMTQSMKSSAVFLIDLYCRESFVILLRWHPDSLEAYADD